MQNRSTCELSIFCTLLRRCITVPKSWPRTISVSPPRLRAWVVCDRDTTLKRYNGAVPQKRHAGTGAGAAIVDALAVLRGLARAVE